MNVERKIVPTYKEYFFTDEGREESLSNVGRAVNEIIFLDAIIANPHYNPEYSSNSESYEMRLQTRLCEFAIALQFPDDDEEFEAILSTCREELSDFPYWNKNNRMREEDLEIFDIENY